MIRIILVLCISCIVCPIQAQVSKGDIIDINGEKGIVFQTDGVHGKAMSVKALRGVKNAWCRNGKACQVKTISKESGQENMNDILRFIEDGGLDINDFPAIAWCNSLGKGWYIPATKEMETFVNWWLGNDIELDWGDEDEDEEDELSPVVDSETPHMKQVNGQLLDAGGIPFINGAFTSTENRKGKLSVFGYHEKKKFWRFFYFSKTGIGTMCLGRAFYEF